MKSVNSKIYKKIFSCYQFHKKAHYYLTKTLLRNTMNKYIESQLGKRIHKIRDIFFTFCSDKSYLTSFYFCAFAYE